MSGVTRDECEAFIDSNPRLSAKSRNAELKLLSAFFSWCKARGYCAENPTREIEFRKEVETAIGILAPNELRRLLENADPQLLAYVAIGAFAGIRKAELHRLDWSEIDLHDGFIEVTAAKSKTANRRLVKIQPCLDAWLRPIARESGPVVAISDLWLRMKHLRAKAGFVEWPQNALRHSFASYHLAHFKNAAELALEMGHAGTNMIFKHYRQVVRAGDAAEYWSILPAQPENVLAMALANTPPSSAELLTLRRRDPVTHKFFAQSLDGEHYQKSPLEYAKIYGVTQQCVSRWIRLGKPLDDPAAMEALRRGEYEKSAEHYARTYGAAVAKVKLWMAHGWPLDNESAVKSYLEHREAVAAHPRAHQPKIITLPSQSSDSSAKARTA